jgi:protein-disulfide isomerase
MRLAPFALLLLVPALTTAAPTRDWRGTAMMKPDGAYVIGNPAAKVKLTEWASYTCSHCAHFSIESEPVLKGQMIRAGSTSLEVRHLVRDPLDFAAAIVARCGGVRHFAATHAAIMAAQPGWLEKGATYIQGNATALQAMAPEAATAKLAEAAGLTAIGVANGTPAPRIAACFADKPANDKLLALSASLPAEVRGTPTFFVNGKLVEGNSWAQLQPALRTAGARP